MYIIINNRIHQMNDSNSIYMITTTLFVSYLMEKFNFSTTYYGMLHTLILQIILWIVAQNFGLITLDVNILYAFFGISLIVLFCIIVYKRGNIIMKRYGSQYVSIKLYKSDIIQVFVEYVKINKEFFELANDTDIGDSDLICKFANGIGKSSQLDYTEMNSIMQAKNTNIYFDDKNLNIKGYYSWKIYEHIVRENDKSCTLNLKYIDINIKTDNANNIYPEGIIESISEYVNNKNKDQISLGYIKLLNEGQTHDVTFYSGKREPLEILENKYIKTLFHQERDRLWEIIKNNIINPDFYTNRGQHGRISFLFHGPPGTGKSTFAYRIAMCLHRHIISLDLRTHTKAIIYQILQKPYIRRCKSYKDVIYLFEEFDISIKELYQKQNASLVQETDYQNKIKYINFDKYDKSEFDMKDKYDQYITNIRSQFSLRDLLEIFQGPIPFESMILLASTNKYDEINNMCPELFRPGRMTPIHFGYIDKNTIQDICKFYFNKKITYRLPDQITIPTSQIIDLALEALTLSNNKAFKYFSDKLEKLL